AGFPSQVGNLSRFSDDRVVKMLERERPDVLGLSVFTFNRHASHQLATLAKRVLPDLTIVAGGPHVTHLDRAWLETYREFDAVIRGEGEDTLLELVKNRAASLPIAGVAGTTARDTDGSLV